MIVSEILFTQAAQASPSGSWRPDPARLGAGILTGIGFLGAGTIMRHENFVIGVTTAASLWFVTVLGLTFGSGLYALGLFGVVIALLTLFALPLFEKYIHTDFFATLTVTAAQDSLPDQQLKAKIEESGLTVLSMKLDYDLEKRQQTVCCELKLNRSQRFDLADKVTHQLAQAPGVLQVKWE